MKRVIEQLKKVRLNKSNEKLDWRFNDEIGELIQQYNVMVDKLEQTAVELATTERESAWKEMAQQVAHEIKNPLTPIQLSIDSLREKYKKKLTDHSQEFEKYLETINRQIRDIEKLVNEFSSFARMPRPILKKINFLKLINKSLDFVKMTSKASINLKVREKKAFINGDEDQLNRVFINLIKNSEEAFEEIRKKRAFGYNKNLNQRKIPGLYDVDEFGEGGVDSWSVMHDPANAGKMIVLDDTNNNIVNTSVILKRGVNNDRRYT